MTKLPAMSGKEFIKFLEYIGFNVTRQKGSHARLHADDGRVTTIPVHGKHELPKGLLRKIIREDLELSIDEFMAKFRQYKKE